MSESIVTEIQNIAEEICDHYCKYPELYKDDEDMAELLDEHCQGCPVNKLV